MCWLIGEPDQALAQARRAVATAQRMGDPYAIGHTFVTLARIHLFRRDPVDLIRAAAEAAVAVPDARVWHPQAALLVAWARSADQPLSVAAADELLREVRDRATRLPMGTTFVALPVIDLLRRAGYPDKAAALVDELLVFAHDHDERMVEPELIRLRGELLEPTDPVAAAAAYLEALRPRACALDPRARAPRRDPARGAVANRPAAGRGARSPRGGDRAVHRGARAPRISSTPARYWRGRATRSAGRSTSRDRSTSATGRTLAMSGACALHQRRRARGSTASRSGSPAAAPGAPRRSPAASPGPSPGTRGSAPRARAGSGSSVRDDGGGGGVCAWPSITLTALGPSNTSLPVTSQYATQPSE